MTLEALKEEYIKSIDQSNNDMEQLIDEIGEASTLEEFVQVVSLWSSEAPTIGAPMVILKRILTVE